MKSATVLVIALLLILIGAAPSMALWPTTTKLGCWGIYSGSVRQGKIVISLNAVPESAGVYSIHGKWVDPALASIYYTPQALTGTALVVGTKYFISTMSVGLYTDSGAHRSSWHHHEFLISRSSLVGNIYEGTSNIGSRWSGFQVKPISCP